MKQDELSGLLQDAAARAADYLQGLDERQVAADPDPVSGFETELPERGRPASEVLAELDRHGSPATSASAGGRYFGFVIGGALPATVAASYLATAWDQNAALNVISPVAARLEELCERWLVEMLGLPPASGVGFVTAATTANLCALATARHALLAREGWDVAAKGLYGAPPLTVIVGDEVHVSIQKALNFLGLGRDRVLRVPVDERGRMRADLLPAIDGPTIVCTQAGNVNTGEFDPVGDICDRVAGSGAWVHVDGAFGLWARACPGMENLTGGLEKADSWAADAHKWLNVPYDSGLVFVREAGLLSSALAGDAAYLVQGDEREPWNFTPELSRRARGIEIWAALRSLGRAGVIEMLERNCRQARRFAEGLREAGFEILNEVVLNQVLVSFGEPEFTTEVIRRIQQDGTCWCSGTHWQGRTAMRISVSSWATTDEDVEQSLAAMIRCARQ